MTSLRSCPFLMVLGVLMGCTPYVAQRHVDQTTPVKPRDVVWIWSHGSIARWQTVVITHDSVSGIPYEMALCGDACRRSLPRTEVDSMTVDYIGHRTTAKQAIVGVGVAAVVLTAAFIIEYILCELTHECGS